MTRFQSATIHLCVFFSLFVIGHAGAQEADTPASPQADSLLRPAQAQHVDPNADYVIGPEDLLEIEVFQVEELKKRVRVSSQGYIALPLVGQIQAKGLTPTQLEREIAARLDKYLQDPMVSVYVAEYKGQRISVIGAVRNPQVYAASGQKYLLDMLSVAGGVTGGSETCYILRPSLGEDGKLKTETIVIDLKELFEKGNIGLNVPIFGGDVINVPSGGVVFVDGAVNRSGAFPMQGSKTTLIQTLAMAGGVRFEASSDIKIFRDNGSGQRDIISVDYGDIKDGEREDICLKDKDIIMVSTSGIKNFFNSIFHFSGSVPLGGGAMSLGR
ncbi:MAG: polysaccharide biosynthesis/export family protein [Thermodesulfovibrionales bacterium]|jgi:polysaccharide export outer membrane protein